MDDMNTYSYINKSAQISELQTKRMLQSAS